MNNLILKLYFLSFRAKREISWIQALTQLGFYLL